MSNQEEQPDYGSTLVWSNDDSKNVAILLKQHDGNVDQALKRLFTAGSTNYETALRISGRFAPYFGITPVDFMKKYRLWRKGKL